MLRTFEILLKRWNTSEIDRAQLVSLWSDTSQQPAKSTKRVHIKPGLRVNAEPQLSVEWTTTRPQPYSNNRSSNFNVWGAACHLEVHSGMFFDGNNYALYFCAQDQPAYPFHVTVFLSEGNCLFLPGTKTVEWVGDHVVWKKSRYEVSKVVPDFHRLSTWRFRVVIHAGRNRQHSENGLKGPNSVPDTSSCLESLLYDLSKLQEDSSDHDVSLRCEGQVLSAHRSILSARSDVFKAMLQSDMLESRTGVVDIQDMVLPALQHFLRYLYTGALPDLTVDLAEQLYEAGDKYAVEALRKRCSDSLKERLEKGNACRILVLADIHGDQDLKENVLRYIKEKDIPKKWSGWREFCDSHQKLAVEFLNHLYEVQVEAT